MRCARRSPKCPLGVQVLPRHISGPFASRRSEHLSPSYCRLLHSSSFSTLAHRRAASWHPRANRNERRVYSSGSRQTWNRLMRGLGGRRSAPGADRDALAQRAGQTFVDAVGVGTRDEGDIEAGIVAPGATTANGESSVTTIAVPTQLEPTGTALQ